MAEWLRRKTRNLLGFSRAGSNPAAVVFLDFGFGYLLIVDFRVFGLYIHMRKVAKIVEEYVTEWTKVMDLKPIVISRVGSNPAVFVF